METGGGVSPKGLVSARERLAWTQPLRPPVVPVKQLAPAHGREPIHRRSHLLAPRAETCLPYRPCYIEVSHTFVT